MSVAFRRDSDEEHLEPKFELPIPAGPNLVTAGGLALIRSRVDAIEAGLAGLAGDEAALKAARRDLRYWRTCLATAEIAPAPAGDVVAFGCKVAFRLNGQVREIEIVGHDEAEPAKGRLSFLAPLSRALMDAEAGEFVDFNGKEGAIEVLSITPS